MSLQRAEPKDRPHHSRPSRLSAASRYNRSGRRSPREPARDPASSHRMRQKGTQLIGSQSTSRHLPEGGRTLRNAFAAAGSNHMTSGAPAVCMRHSFRRIGPRPRKQSDKQNCSKDSACNGSAAHWDCLFGFDRRIAPAQSTAFDSEQRRASRAVMKGASGRRPAQNPSAISWNSLRLESRTCFSSRSSISPCFLSRVRVRLMVSIVRPR